MKEVKRKETGVFRLTVDEILADNLIRFEICTLKKDVKSFFDESGIWTNTTGEYFDKKKFGNQFGAEFSWDELKEGQVYVIGEFESIEDKEKRLKFVFRQGKKTYKRIDNLDQFRDDLRKLYSNLLTREI